MLSRTVELLRGSLDVLDEGKNEKERFAQTQMDRKWTNDELGVGTHVLAHGMVVESKQNCRDRSDNFRSRTFRR